MADRLSGRNAFAVALALDLVGAGAALLISTRPWQSVVTHRPRPFADTLLHVSGRTVDAGPTALAVVAIAGLVAVLATRGVARRVVGVLLLLAGLGLVWRSVAAVRAIGMGRAQSLAASKHPGITLGTHVEVHLQWPILSAIAGGLVVAAGALIASRGHRWAGMSSRYEPPSGSDDRARADATMWAAIERGDDPTSGGQEAL